MKDNKWYLEEVVKLLAIMKQDNSDKNIMVSREYIIEKLTRIISETGIGIHPTLELYVKNAMENLKED